MLDHFLIPLDKVGNLDFSGLLALLGSVFVFWQYKENFFQKQQQIILILKNKLDISESWAGGDGYIGEPSDKQKLMFSEPFRLINEIENSDVDELSLQPGIVDFSQEFNRYLAGYNQQIRNIHGLVNFRKALAVSNFENAALISDAKKKTEYDNENYEYFLKIIKSDGELVDKLCRKFYKLDETIHFDRIGSKNSDGLNAMFHGLKEELEKQVIVILRRLIVFDATFFFLIFLAATAIAGFAGFHLTNERVAFLFLFLGLTICFLHERERRSWLSIINEK